MEKKVEKEAGKPQIEQKAEETQEQNGKVSKTWEAIQKWRGTVTVNDPTLLQ